MRYWLFKTEPGTFSIDDLKNKPGQTTHWEGVRNYQARNFLRDQIKTGDLVFFYHSVVKPPAIMGIAEVVREGYADFFAFDADSNYFDPQSSPEKPRWYMVDIRLVREFSSPVTLAELKNTAGLEQMELLKTGSRLSIQPVSAAEWQIINRLRP